MEGKERDLKDLIGAIQRKDEEGIKLYSEEDEALRERYVYPAVEYMKRLPGDLPFRALCAFIGGPQLPFFATEGHPLSDSQKMFNVRYYGQAEPSIDTYR